MEKINDGGPAFPLPLGNENIDHSVAGMSLRDYLAAAAIPALINKLNFSGLYRDECMGDSVLLAETAYMISDAMLKAREVKS